MSQYEDEKTAKSKAFKECAYRLERSLKYGICIHNKAEGKTCDRGQSEAPRWCPKGKK
jgi:hypothetical protein